MSVDPRTMEPDINQKYLVSCFRLVRNIQQATHSMNNSVPKLMVSFLIVGHICLLHKQKLDAALCSHAQPVASLHEYSDVMVCESD